MEHSRVLGVVPVACFGRQTPYYGTVLVVLVVQL